MAFIALIVGTIHVPGLRIGSLVLLYGAFVVGVGDSYFMRRRVQRVANEKFGVGPAAGVGNYALMRSLQFRRARMPKPRVKRGEAPIVK